MHFVRCEIVLRTECFLSAFVGNGHKLCLAFVRAVFNVKLLLNQVDVQSPNARVCSRRTVTMKLWCVVACAVIFACVATPSVEARSLRPYGG